MAGSKVTSKPKLKVSKGGGGTRDNFKLTRGKTFMFFVLFACLGAAIGIKLLLGSYAATVGPISVIDHKSDGTSSSLKLVNFDGTLAKTVLTDSSNNIFGPRLSPDKSKVAYVYYSPTASYYVLRIVTVSNGQTSEIKASTGFPQRFVWVSNTKLLYYDQYSPSRDQGVFTVNSDGTGEAKIASVTRPLQLSDIDLSSNGTSLAFWRIDANGGAQEDVVTLPISGGAFTQVTDYTKDGQCREPRWVPGSATTLSVTCGTSTAWKVVKRTIGKTTTSTLYTASNGCRIQDVRWSPSSANVAYVVGCILPGDVCPSSTIDIVMTTSGGKSLKTLAKSGTLPGVCKGAILGYNDQLEWSPDSSSLVATYLPTGPRIITVSTSATKAMPVEANWYTGYDW